MTIEEYNKRFAAGKPVVKRSQRESKMQTTVAKYVRAQYPRLIFFFDAAAGISLNPKKSTRDKLIYHLISMWRSSEGIPDGFFAKPMAGYAGLFTELKTELNNPYLKDGSVSTSKKVQKQHKVHEQLREDGYFVLFTVGVDHTIAVINWYMQGCVGECPKYISKKSP
jgi:hypothetical protein